MPKFREIMLEVKSSILRLSLNQNDLAELQACNLIHLKMEGLSQAQMGGMLMYSQHKLPCQNS